MLDELPPPDLEEPLLLLPLDVDDVDEAGDGDASLSPGDAEDDGRVVIVTGDVTVDDEDLGALAEDLVDAELRSCGELTADGVMLAPMPSAYLQLLLLGLSSPLEVGGVPSVVGPGPGLVGMWCWRCVRWWPAAWLAGCSCV